MREPRDGPGVPRRRILRVLAVAPAALAGCAGARGARSAAAEEGGDGAHPQAQAPAQGAEPSPAPRPVGAAAVEAVRAFRLPPEAEPAAIFRAAAARPGEPR